MSWAWLAILLGSLIVGSRSILVVDPRGAIELSQRIADTLFRTDLRVRGMGALYAALAALCVLAGDAAGREPDLAGPATLLMVFGVLYLGAAVWALASPGGFRATSNHLIAAFSRRPAATRISGVVAMVIGVWLIVLGVQALQGASGPISPPRGGPMR